MRTSPSADSRVRLLAPLGHGGMSDVWLGTLRGPAGFEKLVAVKQLRFIQSDRYDRGQAFLREARLAALLNHPNIVQTFEVLAQGGDYRIVMEFLEGQPLNRILKRLPGAIPLPDLIRALVDVLAGLHYAHELTDPQGTPLGVVHRDVSPHNVFVSYEGGVKLLDFGIAAFGREEEEEGLVKGKLTYMAPEQASGGPIDRRADLFAVGVILWEILAGRQMWVGRADRQLYADLVAGNVPSIHEAAPSAPEPLRRICAKALSRTPGLRYPTALAMRQPLDDWLGSHRPDPLALGERLSIAFAADRERIRTIVAHSVATEDDDTDDTDLYAPTPAAGRPRPLPLPTPASDPAPRTAARWLVPLTGALSAFALSGLALGALALAAGVVYWAREDIGLWLANSGYPAATSPTGTDCPPLDRRPRAELSGNIDDIASLSCARDYLLSGTVRVLPGASMKIAPGTVIRGNPDSVLLIEPGAKILAEGTPQAPIVFTSAARTPAAGDWGGIVVLGRAPTNMPDPRFKGLSPEGDLFGGDDPEDDSGVLRFVRIEYAGTVLAPNNETNGLTLAAVGRGTTLDHVQVRYGADDCFEWFGGTVDASHLVCLDPGDDGFDIEFGYRGRLSSLVLVDRKGGGNEHNGIEVDSDPGVEGAEPRTSPVITSATLCATRSSAGYALLVRRGAVGTYADLWVDGYAAALDVRDRGGQIVRDLAVAPGTPLAPREKGSQNPDLPARDDDGGIDEAELITNPDTARRCTVPPLGPRGALQETDRWDEGWVVWE